jgi:dipeptidyl aminopeptidase/acylaminoacyl peptidase
LLILAGCLLASLCFAALIAVRNYRAAHVLIEAEQPSPLLINPGEANLASLQSVTFLSRGQRLAGWYIPSKNRAAVVVTHGTISDRTGMLAEVRLLSAAGFGVLAFDWPGMGESEGHIQWGTQAQDALRAALDWLVAKPEIDSHRIGGLGFSIGGFILTQVAAKDQRLRAIVVESAANDFDIYVAFHFSKWGVFSRWPARWALRNSGMFSAQDSALRRIAEVSPRPVFIIGETDDPNVPAWMIRTLAAAAREPKQLWLISGAQHGSYEASAGAEYGRRVNEFFEDSLVNSPAQ